MIVLFSHIRTGKWSSIMPLNLAETFGFAEPIRAIPIVEPDASHLVGLVAAPSRAAHAAGFGDAARGAAGRGRAWLVSIENFYRSTEQLY